MCSPWRPRRHRGGGPARDRTEFDDGGLPGLLTPEQTAALLARRDQELHKRLKAVP